MTAKIEEKLYGLFEKKLAELEDRINGRINPKWRPMQRLQEEWADFLSKVPGAENVSKIMSLILQRHEDVVWVKNPLVIGGNQGIISVPRETATKIVALGYIPQEET